MFDNTLEIETFIAKTTKFDPSLDVIVFRRSVD